MKDIGSVQGNIEFVCGPVGFFKIDTHVALHGILWRPHTRRCTTLRNRERMTILTASLSPMSVSHTER